MRTKMVNHKDAYVLNMGKFFGGRILLQVPGTTRYFRATCRTWMLRRSFTVFGMQTKMAAHKNTMVYAAVAQYSRCAFF